MPDPTIPELVARLRELNKYATRAPWKADSGYNGGGISTAFFHIPGHNGGATVEMIEVDALLLLELRNNLPTLLDALERQGSHLESLTTWRPIDECGELEAGAEYLVRMKHADTETLAVPVCELITIARWSGAEWQVRIGDAERYYYRADHITHVHRMGPIRGPGEGQ